MPAKPAHLRNYRELDGKTFLIGVGAMKCATSWVYCYLASLGEVTVSPLKEVHFFNSKFPRHSLMQGDVFAMKRLAFHIEQEGDPVDNLSKRPAFQASLDRAKMIYDDNEYFGHFARLCTATTRTLCDITPAYAIIGRAGFDYMKTFCASQDFTLRLLFIMRDPVDRLWSQLRWMEYVDPNLDIAANWAGIIQEPRVATRADYRQTVEVLDAVFPQQDILYLFYEDLFSEASLNKLCAFANAASKPADIGTIRNETSVKIALPEAARVGFRSILAAQYDFCRERFGALVPSAWKA